MIRHGESIWNNQDKFTGWTNIPLSDNGKKESINIANKLIKSKLYPNIIFSSVLERSINTSNLIKLNLELEEPIQMQTSWRLNEKHYGTLEGIPRNIIKNEYGEKFTKMLRSNFYMKPPVIKNQNYPHEYPIYKNCYYNKIKYGESKENVLDRLLPYYENDILYTLTENKFPLLVTHKHTARVLMKYLLKISDEEFEFYELPDKKILLIELNNYFEYIKHDEIEY
jgi:2,3-bisphosphoglycerate-dependent phosphoglycerate mutase